MLQSLQLKRWNQIQSAIRKTDFCGSPIYNPKRDKEVIKHSWIRYRQSRSEWNERDGTKKAMQLLREKADVCNGPDDIGDVPRCIMKIRLKDNISVQKNYSMPRSLHAEVVVLRFIK